jgi:predicted small secreted protein
VYLHRTQETVTMRKIIVLAALAASLALAACNTVAGAGKDVSSAGHAVTDTADDAKPH